MSFHTNKGQFLSLSLFGLVGIQGKPVAFTLRRKFEEQEVIDVSGAVITKQVADEPEGASAEEPAVSAPVTVEEPEHDRPPPKKKAKKPSDPAPRAESQSRSRSGSREPSRGGLQGLQSMLQKD